MGEDFLCSYEPTGGAIIDPIPLGQTTLSWTEDAEKRIARVPAFVRSMVRRRAEDHVRSLGRAQVTATDLDALARLKFGGRIEKPDFLDKKASQDD